MTVREITHSEVSKVEIKRDGQGRFAPGSTGNVRGLGGRPPRGIEERYINLLGGLVLPEDIKEIVRVALDKAKGGDWRARQWLFDYLWGKPIERRITAEAGDIALEWDDGNEDQESTPAS